MNLVSMQLATDCGPVAMANHLASLGLAQAPVAYRRIMGTQGFPGTENLLDDFWDSPSRHFDVLDAIAERRPQLISDGTKDPHVILLRLSTLCYHWVTYLGNNSWHDGSKVITQDPLERFPNSSVVLRYSLLGHDGDLAWYWGVWYGFTKLMLRLFS
jgi:hypothetical protein